MRCPNPECDGQPGPLDRYCPKCGAAIRDAESALAPIRETPAQSAQESDPAARRVSDRTLPRRPIARHGEAYPALRKLAALYIKAGSVLKWILIAIGVLACLSAIIDGIRTGTIGDGLVTGLIWLALGAIAGWLVWLIHATIGELVYLLLDVTEVFITSHRRE